MEEQIEVKNKSGIKSSDGIGALVLALSKAQGGFDKAYRTVGNTFFNSKYADLATIIAATRQYLCENELAIMQFAEGNHLKVSVTTKLCHSSGEWLESKIEAVPKKPDCQQQGSVITYLRRYAMSAMLGIAQEDDDANSQIHPDLKKIKNFFDYNPDANKLIKLRYGKVYKIPEDEYKDLLLELEGKPKTNTKVKEKQQVNKEQPNRDQVIDKQQLDHLNKISLNLQDQKIITDKLAEYKISKFEELPKKFFQAMVILINTSI